MTALFGEEIKSLKYYWLRQYTLDGIPGGGLQNRMVK